MATIRKDGVSWYLDWREHGTRKRKSLGKISDADARQHLVIKEYELETGHRPGPPSPSFSLFSREYLAWHTAEYPSSSERTLHTVNDLLFPFFEFYNLADIRSRDVREYQAGRMEAGIKTATYLKEFRSLKALLNKAVEWEYLDRNPIAHVKGPKVIDSKPPHFYTKDELSRLYLASNTHRWQWQFMANTGLRRGEAMQLDLGRITGDVIQVLSEEGSRTKSGKWREIPLFDGAREALEHLPDDSFKHITPQSLSRAFAIDAKRADLGGSLHSLRHTFCSHLAMSEEISLQEVRAWAGHSSITTTQRYAHLVPGYRQHKSSLLTL